MRNFIKFGIGCWTRKIELSKSMKLTKGKMSLKLNRTQIHLCQKGRIFAVTLRAVGCAIHTHALGWCKRNFCFCFYVSAVMHHVLPFMVCYPVC